MRPRWEIGEIEKAELREAMEAQKNPQARCRLQCVWLRAAHDMQTHQVAQATGFGVGYVWKVWAIYFKGGITAVIGKPQGGRRRENMTFEKEQDFLEGYRKQAVSGRLVTFKGMKLGYAQKVGHRVPDSTISRILKRHDWRRIKPRPKHPKSDPAAREEFKKTLRQTGCRQGSETGLASAFDVSGRGTLWPHECPDSLLGASWHPARSPRATCA